MAASERLMLALKTERGADGLNFGSLYRRLSAFLRTKCSHSWLMSTSKPPVVIKIADEEMALDVGLIARAIAQDMKRKEKKSCRENASTKKC